MSYLLDPDTGRLLCDDDEHLCLECRGFVFPSHDKVPEEYGQVGFGPLPTSRCQVWIDGVEIHAAYAASPRVAVGPSLTDVGPDGWVAVFCDHMVMGRMGKAKCQKCQDAFCSTLLTGAVSWGFTRPIRESLEALADAEIKRRMIKEWDEHLARMASGC